MLRDSTTIQVLISPYLKPYIIFMSWDPIQTNIFNEIALIDFVSPMAGLNHNVRQGHSRVSTDIKKNNIYDCHLQICDGDKLDKHQKSFKRKVHRS